LPTGAITVVINLSTTRIRIFRDEHDDRGMSFAKSVVWGPRSSYVVRDTSRAGAVLGVQFHAGWASAILGIPAGELTDAHVPLEDLWGAQAERIRQRLLETPGIPAMFDAMEQELFARCVLKMEPHPAVSHALIEFAAHPSLIKVEAIRRDTGYSAKRFLELFDDAVGVTPKRFTRIKRLEHVIRGLVAGKPIKWAQVAADGGLYDQAPLNREFRIFAGITPGAYRPVSADRPHHVPIR
jgi:AraC-like DNA-binding protein